MFSSNTSAANGAANYIEDVFSTWLYAGTGSTQTINNGIDLAGKGGLVWIKTRTNDPTSHVLIDTVRGNTKLLSSNNTGAQVTTPANVLTSFNATGFSLGADTGNYGVNFSSDYTYASWTFREQPKFFDVVTYTGNGTTNNIAHSLASVPGMVIIKKTSTTSNWWTMNRDSSGNYLMGYLNSTGSLPQVWAAANTSTYLTSTTLNVNSIASVSGEDMNASGVTYVAYLFAHNAGGFGLTGTDNVISCGSFTTTGSTVDVNLGYEPQWVMFKAATTTDNWRMVDSMRGWTADGTNTASLFANTSGAETSGTLSFRPTATGFTTTPITAGTTYIYIAIRRGPMKTPTTGTSVFSPTTVTQTANVPLNMGFPADFFIARPARASGTGNTSAGSRLQGGLQYMFTNKTDAEAGAGTWNFDSNIGLISPGAGESNQVTYGVRRAPGFMDVCCYTGTGSARTVAHNLTAVPELIIVKSRSLTSTWPVYTAATSATNTMDLSSTGAATTLGAPWSGTSPTASVFTISGGMNTSGATYVAYLFASCPGVQSIQSYVGDGTTGRTINCGFTGGARFVCIKATSTTGSWWTFDSARGIVTNNDPALQLNSTAAEVTSADAVDTAASGFIVNQEATCSLNASGVTYLVWAIA